MTARIILLVTSPRLPAGLMTAPAWDTVRAHPVFAGAHSAQAEALRAAGVTVSAPEGPPVDALLDAAGTDGTVVWLGGAGGDERLARELGLRLLREPGRAELELMYGSWDPPGARLLDAVAVLDTLVSPGGDPWKRGQTHQSLAQYLIEECYEAFDAISAGDLGALREELGDLLLQVVLHARLAEDLPEGERWSVDDVAGGLVEKMIRRNPHVFGDATVAGVDDIIENWEQIKRAEKARDSVMDGIALAQPALSLAAKVLSRARRAGIGPLPPLTPAGPAVTGTAAAPAGQDAPGATAAPAGQVAPGATAAGAFADEAVPCAVPAGAFADEAVLGAALLAAVSEAGRRGLDAEAALRRAALAYVDQVRAAERPPSAAATTDLGDAAPGVP